MNTGEKIKRYIWIVHKLQKCGRLTLSELQDKWISERVDEGNPLARATLFRYRDAIRDMLGVEIASDNYKRYYISNPHVLGSDQLQQWLLSMMTTQSVLSDCLAMAHRIILEQAPLGVEFLQPIITAMKQGRKMTLAYQKFKGDWSERILSPYALRFYMGRWYMLCDTDNGLRIFALDRFDRLTMEQKKFKMPADFSADDYFSEFFGVLTDHTVPLCHVVIRAYGKTSDFIRTLPLHHSQQAINITADYTDYSVDLRPTPDFIGQLFSYDEGVEVLQPQDLRQQVKSKLQRMLARY